MSELPQEILNPQPSVDSEAALLDRIESASRSGERLTQRDLAQAVGLSLGMTNLLVRKLVDRGWLSLHRHSTKHISYALTAAGLSEVGRRKAGMLRQASQLISTYSARLEQYVVDAKRRGVGSVVMVGHSEAEVILERLCERYGLVFLKSADPQRARSLARNPSVTLVFAEGSPSGAEGYYL